MHMRYRLSNWAAVLAWLMGFAPLPSIAQVTLAGRVVDENRAPVRGALIAVRHTGSAATSAQAETAPTGDFTVSLPEPGDYLINVERQGFYPLHERQIHVEPSNPELTLTLNTVREVFQSVDVNEQTTPVEQAAAGNQSRLSGTEVNDISYATVRASATACNLFLKSFRIRDAG